MTEKAVVLCSGGFDSVTLAHDLAHNLKDTELHTLFFRYGQRSLYAEEKCARKVSEKLGCEYHTITLPTFDWTKSNFFGDGFKSPQSQYLEYRNLIFLSYALSLAQSIGAKKIYMAILKSHYGYADTSPQFLTLMNAVANLQGIEVITPYANYDKDDLLYIAYRCGVESGEWHSCDTPNFTSPDGYAVTFPVPCGECLDCKSLEGFDDFLKMTPIRAHDYFPERYAEAVKNYPLYELRVLLNNECQCNCAHCFYGFDEMKAEPLTLYGRMAVIKEAIKLGAKSIHYAGKEPLIDRSIFSYAEAVRKINPDVEQSVVTNGINVPKYIEDLAANKLRVMLSVDTSNVLRASGDSIVKKALESLKKAKVPTTVFIDLHSSNYDKIYSMMYSLLWDYHVKTFHIRTLRPIGNGANIKPLSAKQLAVALNQAIDFSLDMGNVLDIITTDIGCADYQTLLSKSSDIDEDIKDILWYDKDVTESGTTLINNHFSLKFEKFCYKYLGSISLTPDGYIFGCGMEMGNPDYDRISIGNVRDGLSLSELLEKGKQMNIKLHSNDCDICKCCHYKDR